MKTKLKIIAIALGVSLVTACANSNNAQKGAGVGALIGAVAGKATGDNDKSRYAWGAVVGAIAGGAIGAYMDRQEEALKEELADTGIELERVGDQLTLIIPSSLTFDVDSASINSGLYPVLSDVASVLQEFEKTKLSIEGHTDATGSDEYNKQLSIERANAVADFLASQDIQGERLRTIGFGETQPIASNSSDTGREQNRRVELNILPVSQS